MSAAWTERDVLLVANVRMHVQLVTGLLRPLCVATCHITGKQINGELTSAERSPQQRTPVELSAWLARGSPRQCAVIGLQQTGSENVAKVQVLGRNYFGAPVFIMSGEHH